MVTTGESLVVSACPEVHPWCVEHLAPLSFGEAFEAYWISQIERMLDETMGVRLWGPEQVFFPPDTELSEPTSPGLSGFRVETLKGDEIPTRLDVRQFETGLQALQPGSLFTVAFSGKEAIGVCGGTPNQLRLVSLYIEVLPDWQKEGLGFWLATKAIRELQEAGSHVYIRNSLANVKSTRLAQRLGFLLGWLELAASR